MQPSNHNQDSSPHTAATNNDNNVLKSRGKSRKPIVKWVVIGVMALIVAATTVCVVTGVVYVGFKQPEQKVVVQTVVCGDDIIKRYNQLSMPLGTIGQQNLNQIVKDFTANPDYVNDPACQAILWWNALRQNKGSDMEKTLTAIQGLYDKGLFVNGSLQNTYSFPTMKMMTNEVVNGSNEVAH